MGRAGGLKFHHWLAKEELHQCRDGNLCSDRLLGCLIFSLIGFIGGPIYEYGFRAQTR